MTSRNIRPRSDCSGAMASSIVNSLPLMLKVVVSNFIGAGSLGWDAGAVEVEGAPEVSAVHAPGNRKRASNKVRAAAAVRGWWKIDITYSFQRSQAQILRGSWGGPQPWRTLL